MEKWTIIQANEVRLPINLGSDVGSSSVLYLKGSDPALVQSKHEYGPFYTELDLTQFATLHGITLDGA